MAAILQSFPPQDLDVIEVIGVPEIFANGTILDIGKEVVVITMYRERRRGEEVERYEVARCLMSREDYDATLRRAYVKWTARGH